ncbi:hypothetical protein DFR86_03595 [Acidianus sulfidivorans JP7]|uniref:Uncharacterized protein n=1 Tax=Acidianus sulfidivorans JP7 TaxID=619593 RepID=A0A2U9IL30_9CREN|nr:hypothetical protein [Acidianus sulfidivorans]AWR96727.1 hypothetical protein DFR86_03595 [Acidianus sulfidivorans JP7]
MKCSTDSIKEIRGFQFLINEDNKDELTSKIQEIKSLADSSNNTHILRIAESNYYRFELIFVPKSLVLLSVSTARGTNNINLRDFKSLDNLATLACCASQNEQLKEVMKGFLDSNIREVEIYDLFSKKEEIEVSPNCDEVKWNELKTPEVVPGKWNTTQLASVENLSLKALAGQVKFISISTERPQNSIKFTTFNRLESLCCFLNLVKKKLDENKNFVESVIPLLQTETKKKTVRSKKQ